MNCSKNLLEKKYTRREPTPLNRDTLKSWRPRPSNKMDSEAKKLHEWVWELPNLLKELGFQKIKKLRGDKTYVQAIFPLERAFKKGPYETSNTKNQIKNKLPEYDKAICTYADDDIFEKWQKFSDEEKIDFINNFWQDQSGMDKYTSDHPLKDAFNCYQGRYPDFVYKLNDKELMVNAEKDARNSGGYEPLFSAITPASPDNPFHIDFKFSLEVTKDNTVWYGLYFNEVNWEGCTLEELEQDWDDFLTTEFSNAISA